MRRVVIILGLVAAVGIGFWVNSGQTHKISLSDASISRMPDGSSMASVVIANAGAADVLIGVSALGFHHAHIMGEQGDLVIPTGAAPILAGDGAHVILQGNADAKVGEMVPFVLTFQEAGKVTARARIADAVMDHASMVGIEAKDITLRLTADVSVGRDRVAGLVAIEGFEMVSRPNGTAHVEGEGHAHLYLNGLKLQRLYQPEFKVGGLVPGDYVLSVSLNANDHRPYVRDGVPISADIRFTVD